MYSCVDVNNQKQQEKSFGQEVYEEVIDEVEEKVLSDKWMEERIIKRWYEGHEYLVMYRSSYTSFIHNPNCPCQNEK